ncbi:Regucalcin [Eumeta japonica]|uniref:Regucalcin n=1 Tax=Eumeta variegata TaxID=151549 RepID=A0A4C1WVG6_EUMVA|nr:Regucalcin [Eumeta japonica]
MSITIEQLTEPVPLGESPHWDSNLNVLYFISIDNRIHKYDPATKLHTKTKLDNQVGFMVPVDGTSDEFVVGTERKFVVIQWDGTDGAPVRTVKVLGEVDHDVTGTNINDGKADPRGRLFAGTRCELEPDFDLVKNDGSLYRIVGSSTPEKLCDKIRFSNGLTWDLDEKAFYYIDSLDYAIRRYDYDVNTGNISNMRYVFDLKKNNMKGGPDGMTIDTEGNLWIALMGESCVIKIDPRNGKLLQTVTVPVKNVTSVTFGGPNLDVMFLTTANLELNGGVLEPPAGAVFKVTGLGAKGHPNVAFKLY